MEQYEKEMISISNIRNKEHLENLDTDSKVTDAIQRNKGLRHC